MYLILFVFGLIAVCWLSVYVRVAVQNPIHTLFNAIVDGYKYIRYKQWRNLKTGQIICYVGLFGMGKTLSAVHHVVGVYERYNNLKVYDEHRKKWVIQKVHVISNVKLNIPYEEFVSLVQLVQIADKYKEIDEQNNTLTFHVVLGDEFSVQLNSRSFKTNIDPLCLNTVLTSRHHNIGPFVITAQRFNHIDALFRQVTGYVITCRKMWRFMEHRKYDAYELENAGNPLDVHPEERFGWFIRNKDYRAYDTLACVGNLSKKCSEGDFLSEEEILALQHNTPIDMDAVQKPSRRYLKRMKKRGK